MLLALEKKVVKEKLIDISSQLKVKKLLQDNHNNLINYYSELTVSKKKVQLLGFYTRSQGNYIQSLINLKKSNFVFNSSVDLRSILKLNYPVRATSVILDEFGSWTPGTILCFYQNYLIRYHDFNAFSLNYKNLMLRFAVALDA